MGLNILALLWFAGIAGAVAFAGGFAGFLPGLCVLAPRGDQAGPH